MTKTENIFEPKMIDDLEKNEIDRRVSINLSAKQNRLTTS